MSNKVNEHIYNGGKETWRNGQPANQVDEHIMEGSKHGEMDNLPNIVDEHIIEGSEHGEMDDLPNKVNGHIMLENMEKWTTCQTK